MGSTSYRFQERRVSEAEITSRLAKQRALWAREMAVVPLVGQALPPSVFPLEGMRRDLPEGLITPYDIHPQHYAPPLHDGGPPEPDGDLWRTRWALPALPWTEAIAGCPVYVFWEAGTTWAGPALADSATLASFHPRVDRGWYEQLLACTRVLVERAEGNYLVSTTLMRGPFDMLAAMIGTERLCLGFHEEAGEVRRLLDFCTTVWIETALAQLACIPPFHGGYCNRYKVWAPGTSVVTQADLASMISPNTYAEFLLPCDERICASFDYVTMHSHSTGQTQLDLLLDLDGMSAIEVALDPLGPSLEEMLPTFRRILARRPLILMGTNAEQTARATTELPAAGLCIIPRAQTD